MKPYRQQFQSTKSETLENFLRTLNQMNISVLGQDDDLGLISFENDNSLYYTHLISIEESKTMVSISPGLSYMKDRNKDEMPSIIIKIIDKMVAS